MFEVRWLQSALDDLMEQWMQGDATLRAAITAAAPSIDQRLSRNPAAEGESRDAAERVFFVAPLGILFEIDAKASRVYVLHVWVVRRR